MVRKVDVFFDAKGMTCDQVKQNESKIRENIEKAHQYESGYVGRIWCEASKRRRMKEENQYLEKNMQTFTPWTVQAINEAVSIIYYTGTEYGHKEPVYYPAEEVKAAFATKGKTEKNLRRA